MIKMLYFFLFIALLNSCNMVDRSKKNQIDENSNLINYEIVLVKPLNFENDISENETIRIVLSPIAFHKRLILMKIFLINNIEILESKISVKNQIVILRIFKQLANDFSLNQKNQKNDDYKNTVESAILLQIFGYIYHAIISDPEIKKDMGEFWDNKRVLSKNSLYKNKYKDDFIKLINDNFLNSNYYLKDYEYFLIFISYLFDENIISERYANTIFSDFIQRPDLVAIKKGNLNHLKLLEFLYNSRNQPNWGRTGPTFK